MVGEAELHATAGDYCAMSQKLMIIMLLQERPLKYSYWGKLCNETTVTRILLVKIGGAKHYW